MGFVARLRYVHHHNVNTLRQSPLAEISGALGDLGTLLPLMIALALQGSISLSTTLVFSGLFNILTGVVFGIPLPVQPMKAIAAAALASRISLPSTTAAGAIVSAIVLTLATTGLLARLAAVVPVPVVKGIQLGAGLSLCISAGTTLIATRAAGGPIYDNTLLSLLAFLALLFTQRGRFRRFPFALASFLLGLAIATTVLIVWHFRHGTPLPGFQPWRPRADVPDFDKARPYGMALAQLPLTTLNSVLATAALATELFPDLPEGVATPGVTGLGVSVGLMNVVGCWFGAMPVCHGSGGLAAQFRFGARSGASVALLGVLKLVVGLLCGESLLQLLRWFPKSLLGVMVVAAGLELAMVGENLNSRAGDLWETSVREAEDDGEGREEGVPGVLGLGARRLKDLTEEERRERWMIMLTTTAGILAFKNDGIGFVAGMLCHWVYRFSDRMDARRARSDQDEEGTRTSLLD